MLAGDGAAGGLKPHGTGDRPLHERIGTLSVTLRGTLKVDEEGEDGTGR